MMPEWRLISVARSAEASLFKSLRRNHTLSLVLSEATMETNTLRNKTESKLTHLEIQLGHLRKIDRGWVWLF
jgi:hypothetical protein